MKTRYTTLLLVIFMLLSCQKGTNESQTSASSSTIEAFIPDNSSLLAIPIDFPLVELSQMVNKLLPKVLVDDTIRLKKKGDYVKLKIEPTGKLLLNSYGKYLDASLPMKVTAQVSKKVIGIKIKNKEPVVFQIRSDLHTTLAIDDEWNLQADCAIQDIKWITSPSTKILGLKINLQKRIEMVLEKNHSKIESTICESLSELVPVKKQVSNVWELLSKSHRIAKNPVDVWLSSNPSNFSASIDNKVLDTLRVLIQTQTDVRISPLEGKNASGIPLPRNQGVKGFGDKLNVKPKLFVPYAQVDKILEEKVSDSFDYRGASISIGNFKTSTEDDKLKIRFSISGDLEATIQALAYPELTSQKNLRLTEIDLKVESDNSLVNIADWAANTSLTEYLTSKATIPLADILNSLDDKIITAFNKSKLSTKMNAAINFDRIETDKIVFYEDRFEWWFDVEGNAHIYIKSNIIN